MYCGRIGFIGVGNMGGVLARAACRSVGAEYISVSSRTPESARAFAERNGVKASSNKEIAEDADMIFIGVKPNQISGVFDEIAPVLGARIDRVLLVSMAAGVSAGKISALAGGRPVIRIMPNTPCRIGSGLITYCTSGDVTAEEKKNLESVLACAGSLCELPEPLIDPACALAGCGPAFVYIFIESLADAAVSAGLPREKALEFAARTVSGAAETVLQTGLHPGILKDEVCSPGGSTIAGVKALEDGGFRAAAENAVLAAYRRTLELGK